MKRKKNQTVFSHYERWMAMSGIEVNNSEKDKVRAICKLVNFPIEQDTPVVLTVNEQDTGGLYRGTENSKIFLCKNDIQGSAEFLGGKLLTLAKLLDLADHDDYLDVIMSNKNLGSIPNAIKDLVPVFKKAGATGTEDVVLSIKHLWLTVYQAIEESRARKELLSSWKFDNYLKIYSKKAAAEVSELALQAEKGGSPVMAFLSYLCYSLKTGGKIPALAKYDRYLDTAIQTIENNTIQKLKQISAKTLKFAFDNFDIKIPENEKNQQQGDGQQQQGTGQGQGGDQDQGQDQQEGMTTGGKGDSQNKPDSSQGKDSKQDQGNSQQKNSQSGKQDSSQEQTGGKGGSGTGGDSGSLPDKTKQEYGFNSDKPVEIIRRMGNKLDTKSRQQTANGTQGNYEFKIKSGKETDLDLASKMKEVVVQKAESNNFTQKQLYSDQNAQRIAGKVSKIIFKAINEVEKPLRHQKKGDLDDLNLHNFNANDPQPRIWKQQRNKIGKDTVKIAILLDLSGSMQGQKIVDARSLLAGIGEAVKKTKRKVSLDMFGFTGRSLPGGRRGSGIFLHKITTPDSVYQLDAQGGTPLTGAMTALMEELNKKHGRTRETNKRLFILTDGAPSDHTPVPGFTPKSPLNHKQILELAKKKIELIRKDDFWQVDMFGFTEAAGESGYSRSDNRELEQACYYMAGDKHTVYMKKGLDIDLVANHIAKTISQSFKPYQEIEDNDQSIKI